jgi:hypothetical protein
MHKPIAKTAISSEGPRQALNKPKQETPQQLTRACMMSGSSLVLSC